MGGLISFAGYYLLLGVLHIWMCVRIGRSSGGTLGWLTFFFWPTSIYVLIRNWGQDDADIRIPFFACLATVGMMFWSLHRAEEQFRQQGYYLAYTDEEMAQINAEGYEVEYSPEEIAEIRRQDPAMAAEIEANGGVLSVAPQTLRTSAQASGTGTEVDLAEMPMAPGQEVSIRSLAIRELEGKLQARNGRITLETAQATLDLPRHFRFLPAEQVQALANMGVGAIDRHTLGWIVHERVRLADDDGWFVQVRFEPVGALAVPASSADWQQALAYQDQDQPAIEVPTWMAERFTATLLDREARPGETVERARALRVTAHGVLEFRVSGIRAEERELGLRAARLMAARTTAPAPPVAADSADAPAPALSLHAYAQGKATPRG
ncbi:MAG: DUF2167 domain-containing protein [Lysobacterales bacterium]